MRTLISVTLLTIPGIAVGEEPSLLKLVVKPDAYQTLVNPKCSHCRDEAQRRSQELRDDDLVLCWIRGYSDGGAIPVRFFLNQCRVISDSYGVFVYDPDAGFARGFAPSYDFEFHGWRNGVMVMRHKDGTLYSCLTGKAFAGPKQGNQLDAVPTMVSKWGTWLKHYPQTVAYEMFDKYKPKELTEASSEDSAKSRGALDSRLPADEAVLGVTEGKDVWAFRLQDIAKARIIHAPVSQGQWCVLWNGETQTASAYLPLASPLNQDATSTPRPVTLTFDPSHKMAPFVDQETGSHWDVAGRAVEGHLKNWTLHWINGTQVKWFAWSAEYPETRIYGE